jgi:hypothetical protein
MAAAPDAPVVPPPPPEEEKFPPIVVGAWLRAGMQFTGAANKIDDHQFDTVYAELHTSGKVHKNVSWVLNFNANGQGGTNLDRNQQQAAGIEDAIVGLDAIDELHLWVGQLLTPVDRTNASGPFFIIPWTYTGVFAGPGYVGPKGEDVYGRSTGAVLWGDVGGAGKFKYFLSTMNMRSLENRPLLSGRLVLTAIGEEKGFWGNSTWYGAQDVLAFGLGGQYQADGSEQKDATGVITATDKYTEINGDIVAEFKLGEGSAITGEVGAYAFGGDYRAFDNMYYGLVSYLSPPVGPGKLQPMFRYQGATPQDSNATKPNKIDAQLGYIVKDAALKTLIGFSTSKVSDDVTVKAFQLAVQTIF